MVPAGEPWLEVEGTLVPRNFRRSVSEALPSPPITRNQVELMEQDNIPEPDAPGFEALQISPQAIENILPQMLQTLKAPPVG